MLDIRSSSSLFVQRWTSSCQLPYSRSGRQRTSPPTAYQRTGENHCAGGIVVASPTVVVSCRGSISLRSICCHVRLFPCCALQSYAVDTEVVIAVVKPLGANFPHPWPQVLRVLEAPRGGECGHDRRGSMYIQFICFLVSSCFLYVLFPVVFKWHHWNCH